MIQRIVLLLVSIPAPWLVFLLNGQPVIAAGIIGVVLFLAYVDALLNTLFSTFALMGCIAWAWSVVWQGTPTPLPPSGRRRREDRFR